MKIEINELERIKPFLSLFIKREHKFYKLQNDICI
jgi:hypothetical protein